MTALNLLRIKPQNCSKKIKQQIIKLHQKYFKLSAKDIIRYIEHRDVVDIYFYNDKIVATIGFQWYKHDNSIVMYMGNVVIDKRFQGCGIATKSYYNAIIHTIMKFPFHKKYSCIMATTPKAYIGATRLVNYWPKVNKKIERDIPPIIKSFLEANYKESYEARGEYFVIRSAVATANSNIKEDILHTRNEECKAFYKFNPNYKNGDQLPVFATIDISNFLTFTSTILGYKRISAISKKKSKSKKNFFSSIIEMYSYLPGWTRMTLKIFLPLLAGAILLID